MWFKGLIFDMDGTMVDNMRVHGEAWEVFAKRHGYEMSDDVYRLFGKTNDHLLQELFKKPFSPKQLKELASEKEAIYREIYEPNIKPVNGLIELLTLGKELGFKLGVASSAPPENVEFVMSKLNLHSFFDTTVNESMVKHGKPYPDLYNKAAENMGLLNSECLAFEDSPIGIQAALSAQMKVVGITSNKTREELKHAHLIIKDFTEIMSDFQLIEDL